MFGRVIHKRLFPKINTFNYGIYYLLLPLSQLSSSIENKYLKFNRWGLLSFYNKDHGHRDENDLNEWTQEILKKHNVKNADGEIFLLTMPRVLGYVFNPVSFWYCYDKSEHLRAVICEVNNTFGETHTYVCVHDDGRVISNDDYLMGSKVFHVSPFMEREGHYTFRFSQSDDKIGARIDFFDAEGKKKLITALSGHFSKMDENACSKAFWRYPLVTMRSIFLIHYQAMKLFLKGTEYVPKPLQRKDKVTRAHTEKEKD